MYKSFLCCLENIIEYELWKNVLLTFLDRNFKEAVPEHSLLAWVVIIVMLHFLVSVLCSDRTEQWILTLVSPLGVSAVTISTSTYFDGLLVTGLYTSTTVQSSPIPASPAFGFGKSSMGAFNMWKIRLTEKSHILSMNAHNWVESTWVLLSVR